MRHDLAADHKTFVDRKEFALSLGTVHLPDRGDGYRRFLSISMEVERPGSQPARAT
jgi:hypothetical protein